MNRFRVLLLLFPACHGSLTFDQCLLYFTFLLGRGWGAHLILGRGDCVSHRNVFLFARFCVVRDGVLFCKKKIRKWRGIVALAVVGITFGVGDSCIDRFVSLYCVETLEKGSSTLFQECSRMLISLLEIWTAS